MRGRKGHQETEINKQKHSVGWNNKIVRERQRYRQRETVRW